MKIITPITIWLLLFLSATPGRRMPVPGFCDYFVSRYRTLRIPPLQLSYAAYLQDIQPLYDLEEQQHFFEEVKKQLPAYGSVAVTPSEQDELDLIGYETDLNLTRLALEKEWLKKRPIVIPTNNFHEIPGDSAWYRYLLQQWIGAAADPDELYLDGLLAIDTVRQHIDDIRRQSGMDSATFERNLRDTGFYYHSESAVHAAFDSVRRRIAERLPDLFFQTRIPAVSIQRGVDTRLAQTPGYYSDNTFYYNYSDSPYAKRQVAWLFLHEAVPGHHYQQSVAAAANVSALDRLFSFPGFAEGWASYAEELGGSLGAYSTPYDELGKWEWDLVRAVRVPLDIGLNYYGWNDAKALAFWKKYINGHDDIALREINRLRSWPAQAISYRYGEGQILQWRNRMQLLEGDGFDIRSFHQKVLQSGPLPFFLMQRKIFRQQE